jgi:uncharacterized membrane-anchored protein
VAEGLGFGLLFLAFIINFATENSSTKGIFYLIFVFAAGGLAFIIASFIGKAISDKAAISLAKFTAILSIGFMIVMFVFLITALVVAIVSSQFNNDVLFLIIIGLSTVLFLLYLVLDMKSIAKTQQFLNVDNAALTSKLGMIFGFRLLVDLVGLV